MDFKFRYVIKDLKSGLVDVKKYTLSQIEGRPLKSLSPVFSENTELLARNLYTGYRDVTKAEIYDGDIVSIPHCSTFLVIKFHFGGFRAMFSNGDSHELGRVINGLQIMGNIYANPELISA